MSSFPEALLALRDQPQSAALFLDYDGTLAPIVPDPSGARPLPGVPDVLAALAARLSMVAVVSGRPALFLVRWLRQPPGVRIFGLYGLESAGPDGVVVAAVEAEQWRPVVTEVTRRALQEAPDGVGVEPKGLTVTLHWRSAPEHAEWVQEFAQREAAHTGLVGQPGRMALELRPPLGGDKGSVIRRLAPGHAAAGCFGDDLGDLPAFAALAELGQAGMAVARVAVVDVESPPEVAAAADVVVEGPRGALDLLTALVEAP